MPILYLTPTALSDLTLFIFAGFIAGYLGYLARQARGAQPLRTVFLARTFAGIAGYVLLDFLNQTLYPDLAFWFLPLQSITMTFGMVWLVQFAYHVPELYPERRRESRIVFGLTLLLPLWEVGYAVFRYARLLEGEVWYRPEGVDYFVAAVFVWVPVVVLRQMGRADARPVSPSTALRTSLWRKLRNPPDRPARMARGFALVTLLPVGLVIILILRNETELNVTAANVMLSLGLLFTLLAFALVYLNNLPETTSFMARLVAITLAFFLGVLGVVGQVFAPGFVTAYHNRQLLAAPQTLQFTPNAAGGYDITQIPYHYASFDLGARLTYGDDEAMKRLPLGFEFPFYNQRWTGLFVSRHGRVHFGAAPEHTDTLFRYGSAPAIYLMGIDYAAEHDLEPPSGVYAHTASGQLTLTWLEMPEGVAHQNQDTFQLRLYANGVFEMTFVDLPAAYRYRIDKRWQAARVLGALPGSRCDASFDALRTGFVKCVAPDLAPEHIHFNTDLPLGTGPGGVLEDYHRAFRTALHRFLAPLFWLMLGSALLVAGGLPLAFRHNLVQPLKNLLAGVQRVDEGNLEETIPVQFQDEFGTLTTSFNMMTAKLHLLMTDLESQVRDRTAELAETTAYLDNILRSATDYAIVTVDRNLRITYFNPLAETLYGVPAAAVLGKPVTVIPAREIDPARFRAGMRRVETQGAHEYTRTIETAGGPRQIASRLSGIYDQQGELIGYAHFSQDITTRVQTEKQLRAQQRALSAQEERGRLARDLHDSVAQSIHSQVLFSETLVAALNRNKPERAQALAVHLQASARQTIKEMRLMLYQMRLSDEQDRLRDLPQALEARLQAVERRSRVAAELHVEDLPPLDVDWRANLYWLAMEALNNALKYAQAGRVRVTLTGEAGRLTLEIADDGQGFDPDSVHTGGLGLDTMRARAAQLGGTLSIETAPGAGTRVRFSGET